MLSDRIKKGFTLVELIFVLAIIAILVAVGVPLFAGVIDTAKQGAIIANASSLANAINIYNSQNPTDKLTQSEVNGWTSVSDMESSSLGDLCPIMKPEDFTSAIPRVQVNENNVATVLTDIH